MSELSSILNWIRGHLHSIHCEETTIRKIELASEEALVNIIEHAYKSKKGIIQLRIREVKQGTVELVLRDNGPAFDPLQKATHFNPLATLEERPIGGLGILFIRQYMDEVYYKRDKDTNILVLIKRFGETTDSSRLK